MNRSTLIFFRYLFSAVSLPAGLLLLCACFSDIDELAEKLARFIFLETSVFEDVIEEFAVRDVFDHDKDLKRERINMAILCSCRRGLR